MLKIKSSRVYINESFVNASLTIDDGKIIKIGSYSDLCDIDYQNNKIIPGLIDIHTHGYNSYFSGNNNPDGLINWMKYLPNEGVTSFLPSTGTSSIDDLKIAFKIISHYIENPIDKGSNILGINAEGPFISFIKAGAQDCYHIYPCDVNLFEELITASNNHVIYNTVAPEMDKDHKMIKYCKEHNIAVSIGHSNADYDECIKAIDDGVNCFTHTFNAMTQLEQRRPNAVGAALDSDVYCELIADGVHVHPANARILAKLKGKDRLIIVTDAISLKGKKPGIYNDGESDIEVNDKGEVHLPNGTLAGSTNCMNVLLKNAIENMMIDEITAINSMTINPCNLLNIKNKGLLKENYDADIVVLDDDYQVIQTYVKGKACK